MKLLFDIRIAQMEQKRGIGRYFAKLFDDIMKQSDIFVSVIISAHLPFPDFIKKYPINVYEIEKFESYEIAGEFDFLFLDTFFMRDFLPEAKEDLSQRIYPEKVLKYCHQIVGVIYDLMTFVYPAAYYTTETPKINAALGCECAKLADHFFAISDFTKNDVMNFMDVKEEDITVIHCSVDQNIFKGKNSEKPYDVATRTNNIMDITGDAPSKNYANLAKAFAMAYTSGEIPSDAKLYLVCRHGDQFVRNVENALKDFPKIKIGTHVILTNYIPDEELVDLLTNARAFIHASYIEGSGGGALEAYSSGCPAFMGNRICAEYILPECSFDSADLGEIKKTIVKIYNNPDLCKASLDYGRKKLDEVSSWNMGQVIVDKLKELKKNYHKKDRIAVFIPGNGAVAEYAVKIKSLLPNDFDLFADVHNLKDFERLQSLVRTKVSNVFSFSAYEASQRYSNHIAKIFLLGNSPHHFNSLECAQKTKGEPNRFILLPEPTLHGLFLSKINDMRKFIEAVLNWYPQMLPYKAQLFQIKNYNAFYSFARKHNIHMIKPLVEMTGITNIIAYGDKCKELIDNEIKMYCQNQNIKVFIVEPYAYEPFENVGQYNFKENQDKYIVGTFGYPGPTKQTKEIMEAVNILNKEGFPVELLLAGPGVTGYAAKTSNLNHVILKENPSADEWLKLMNSVDLAIQLRPHAHSVGSGCVTELVGLRKECLLTNNFVPRDMADYFSFVDDDVSVKELANKIKNVLVENKPKMNNCSDVFKKYTFLNVAKSIKSVVKENLKTYQK